MLISRARKLAYFRVPKTASSTCMMLLHMHGFEEGDLYTGIKQYGAPNNIPSYQGRQHMTPADAIEAGYVTLDELREWDVYVNVRDPIRRDVSAFVYLSGGGTPEEYKEFVLAGAEPGNRIEQLAFVPQYDYHFVGDERIATPIYDIHDWIRRLGFKTAMVPKWNISRPYNYVDYVRDPQVQAALGRRLERDILLWDQLS